MPQAEHRLQKDAARKGGIERRAQKLLKKEGGSCVDKVSLIWSGRFTRPFAILFGIFAKPSPRGFRVCPADDVARINAHLGLGAPHGHCSPVMRTGA
jgi:hypothetical protein